MATSLSSLEARLTKVQTAIDAILEGGQEVVYNGRRVAYADLAELQKHETYLEKRIDRLSRGGIKIRRGTPL